MSYAIYVPLHPPTGIEHCIQANFLSNELNLIVTKTSLLQIYKIRYEDKENGAITYATKNSKGQGRPILELVIEKRMFGNVESINAVRFPGTQRDSLILSFKDAKVSVVEWVPAVNDIRVASLHYFEDDTLKEGRHQFFSLPKVKVDTQQRCAAMCIYDNRLVVMPFKRGLAFDDELAPTTSDSTRIAGSYIVDLRKLGIKNLKDYVFLQGYYEPTILLLYEPMMTWTGRVVMRKDTCSLMAVSLPMTYQTSQTLPIIWNVDHIPHDCYRLCSVPEPIGGCLVFATNQLLYFNQNVAYNLVLNDYAYTVSDAHNRFATEKAEAKISMDLAHGVFLSPDQLLVSLKGGELYIFHLIVANRQIQSIRLAKSGNSILTSCLCNVASDLLFFGSRLADSLLIQYAEKHDEPDDDVYQRPEKKMKTSNDMDVNSIGVDVSIYSSDLQNVEDEENLYGTDSFDGPSAQSQLTSFTFTVCDSITNIGPITDCLVSESTYQASEVQEYQQKKSLEFVTCSGYGKNGAMCMLQESIIPELIRAFELPNCVAGWTLFASQSDDDMHSYLVISRDQGTMVLSTGEELQEITDKVDFAVKSATLDVANLHNRQRIVQIVQGRILLLNGVKLVKEIGVETTIYATHILDPYVILRVDSASNSQNIMLLHSPDLNTLQTVPVTLTKDNGSVTACCLFYDDAGIFSETTESVAPPVAEQSNNNNHAAAPNGNSEDLDEEDLLLYSTNKPAAQPKQPEPIQVKKPQKRQYYCAVTRENGRLEIYLLPSFKLAFASPITRAPALLTHNLDAIKERKEHHQQFFATTTTTTVAPDPTVVELAVHSIDKSSFPYLMAFLSNGDFIMYKPFSFIEKTGSSVRFAKVEHDLITRDFSDKQTPVPTGFSYPRITKFENISDKKGVFIGGLRPAWIFCEREYLRIHPMDCDGAISFFTPFHNQNCSRGFIYFTEKGVLKILQLFSHISYDSYWPIRKLHLRCNPYKIAYNKDTNSIAIVVSNKVPRTVEEPDGEKEESKDKEEPPPPKVDPENKPPPPIPAFDDKFELRLISPHNWQQQDKFDLEEHEHILSVLQCDLKADKNNNLRPFLVVGTGYHNGEEVAMKGRILIFETVKTYANFNQDVGFQSEEQEFHPRLNLVLAKEQKGPVSALTTVSGYLMVAVGPKVVLYNFNTGKDLVGLAFYDVGIYIVSLVSIKNYVMIGDIYKSIFFLRWRENARQLDLLAKDYQPLSVYGSEFLVHQQSLGFLVSDTTKNIQIYQYLPQSLESRGGLMLLSKADFHLGARTEKFVRLRMNPLKESSTKSQKHATVFGTHDGGIGCIAPVEELVFKRLFALQNRMTVYLPHFAGLNPKAFRAFKLEKKVLRNHYGNVLDGELLFRYLSLDLSDQRKLARQIGTTVEQIFDNLLEIKLSTSFF